MKVDFNDASSDEHQQKEDLMIEVYKAFSKYQIIPMYLVLIPFTIFCFTNGHRQRFELTILIIMFAKYAVYAVRDTFPYHISSLWFLAIGYTLVNSIGPICHWIYASQYLKTCFLI